MMGPFDRPRIVTLTGPTACTGFILSSTGRTFTAAGGTRSSARGPRFAAGGTRSCTEVFAPLIKAALDASAGTAVDSRGEWSHSCAKRAAAVRRLMVKATPREPHVVQHRRLVLDTHFFVAIIGVAHRDTTPPAGQKALPLTNRVAAERLA